MSVAAHLGATGGSYIHYGDAARYRSGSFAHVFALASAKRTAEATQGTADGEKPVHEEHTTSAFDD